MNENHKAWDLEAAVKYYETVRNKPEDIYESERVFFFPLIQRVKSVLDVGCAAGGTYNIIHKINPRVHYTGIDVSERMIKAAKTLFPSTNFKITPGGKLDFPDNSFDLVLELGVMHHIINYKNFIRECFRVCRSYCLLDLPRLLPKEHKFDINESYMLLNERFHEEESIDPSVTKVPYVLVDAAEILSFLLSDLKPARILVKGYFGECDKSAKLPVDEVCFAVACLEKTGSQSGLIADLPQRILARLKEKEIKFKEPFEWIIES